MESSRCRDLVNKGDAEHKAGQYAAALESFRAAYILYPVPILLFNQARLMHKLGRLSEAKVIYNNYLQQSTALSEEQQRQKARAYLEEVEGTLATQEPIKLQPDAGANPSDESPLLPRLEPAAPIRLSVGTSPPTTEQRPPLPASVPRPLYKRWWFWTALGGVALAATTIGLGVGLGLRASSPPSPAGLDGAMVFERSF